MTDLNELLERVRSATGPDRGLDARIEFTLSGVSFFESDIADLLQVIDEPTGYGKYQKIDSANIPCFTASIDASLALVERVHPWNPWFDIKGCQPRKDGSPGALWIVVMDGAVECRAPTLPLAILAALLSALISKEPQS